MAAYVKYEKFSEDLVRGVHDFDAHTFCVALTNTAPNAATHTVRADITELTTGSGYTQDSHTTTISISRSGGTTTVDGTDVVFTSSGTIGPFRYAVLYNTTPSSPTDPLICYWDYGSSISITSGNTFTVDIGAGAGNDLFTLA